jgi:hypothetical protein
MGLTEGELGWEPAPVMAAGVTNKLWPIADMVAVIDEYAERNAPRLRDRLVDKERRMAKYYLSIFARWTPTKPPELYSGHPIDAPDDRAAKEAVEEYYKKEIATMAHSHLSKEAIYYDLHAGDRLVYSTQRHSSPLGRLWRLITIRTPDRL